MKRLLLLGIVLLIGAILIALLFAEGKSVFALWVNLLSLIAFVALASLHPVSASRILPAFIGVALSSLIVYSLLGQLANLETINKNAFWLQLSAAWILAWCSVEELASLKPVSSFWRAMLGVLIPLMFGVWLLLLWEVLTRGFNVPQVLLPSPSLIAERFLSSSNILWADFKQTFLKSVLIGYAAGCALGFIVAILIDRSPFLKRGSCGSALTGLPRLP